jgi:hypothetical protein
MSSERFEVGPDDCGYRSALGLPGNLSRGRLALAQCFLEAFDRHRQTNLVSVSEAVCD